MHERPPTRLYDPAMVPEAELPETRHAFVGAGDGPCVLLCASSRQFQKDGPWGYYCADDTAARYNASSPEETQDGELAYARFGAPRPTRYRDGLLSRSGLASKMALAGLEPGPSWGAMNPASLGSDFSFGNRVGARCGADSPD